MIVDSHQSRLYHDAAEPRRPGVAGRMVGASLISGLGDRSDSGSVNVTVCLGRLFSWSRFGKLLGAHLNLHPASPSLLWFSAMNFLSVGKGKGRSGIEPSRASESSTSLTPANSRAGQDQPERRHGAIEEELLSTADEIIGSCDRSVYTHLFIRSCSNAATPGFAF